jgi:MFS family permease
VTEQPPSRFRAPTRLFRRVAIDLTPLRTQREFRLLWIGVLVSETGSNMALVALYIQVYAISHSALAVGFVGIVQLIPLIAVGLFGGPLIDRRDRRRILLYAEIGETLGAGVLLYTAIAHHPPLAVVYFGAAIVGGLGGLSGSARSAMTPNLVPRELFPSALALNQAMWNGSQIVGPAIGGIVVAQFGLSWAYGINVVSFAGTIVAALMMTARPAIRTTDNPTTGWAATRAGLRFIRNEPMLKGIFLVDLVAMIFGLPRALFPILALTRFHAGPQVVGYLFASVSAGALLGALTTGWVKRITRHGLATLLAVAIWGLAIIGFGVCGSLLWLAFFFLALAGAADVISAVFRSTIQAAVVPDELRGRVAAAQILVVTGGPRVGDLEAGAVAAAFTPAVSVISGGIVCVAGVAVLAVALPQFAQYRCRANLLPGAPSPMEITVLDEGL